MKDELLKKLAEVKNIGEARGARIIPDVRELSHYKDVLKGIWWYNLATRQLEYSSKAKSHFDDAFTHSVPVNAHGWVRGRVGELKGEHYAFVYTGDFPYNIIPGSVISDMLTKIEAASGFDIVYFVDEEGYDLLESVKKGVK